MLYVNIKRPKLNYGTVASRRRTTCLHYSTLRHGSRPFWLSWPGRGARGLRCGLLVVLPAVCRVPRGCFWAVWSRPFCSWSDPGVSWPQFWPVWGFVPECGVARPRSAFCVCRPVRVRPLPVSLNSRGPTGTGTWYLPYSVLVHLYGISDTVKEGRSPKRVEQRTSRRLSRWLPRMAPAARTAAGAIQHQQLLRLRSRSQQQKRQRPQEWQHPALGASCG